MGAISSVHLDVYNLWLAWAWFKTYVGCGIHWYPPIDTCGCRCSRHKSFINPNRSYGFQSNGGPITSTLWCILINIQTLRPHLPQWATPSLLIKCKLPAWWVVFDYLEHLKLCHMAVKTSFPQVWRSAKPTLISFRP